MPSTNMAPSAFLNAPVSDKCIHISSILASAVLLLNTVSCERFDLKNTYKLPVFIYFFCLDCVFVVFLFPTAHFVVDGSSCVSVCPLDKTEVEQEGQRQCELCSGLCPKG